MTGTDLYVNKPVTIPVIFEPSCTTGTAGVILSLKFFHIVQAAFNFERITKFYCNDPRAK